MLPKQQILITLCDLQRTEMPAEADKYGFSNFARMLMRGKGLNPLLSDSRRRADRTALEVSTISIACSCHACSIEKRFATC